jgi:HlyD family secretion protein
VSRRARRVILIVGLAVAAVGAVVAVVQLVGEPVARTAEGSAVPTARVRKGDLVLDVHTTGELRPGRSAPLMVPPVSASLQILHLLPTGTRVETGEVVIEFDPSEQEYNLEQARSQLREADEEVTRMRADAAVQTAQDEVVLLRARFDVRRAELEVGRNELLSAIDAQKNLLSLEEAKRRLEQLEEDVASRAASQQASLAVLEERRTKARIAMNEAQRNIDNMVMRAPMAGLVAVKENSEGVNFFFTGMTLPEYREGDLTSSGRLIAEIHEMAAMELVCQVPEHARSTISPGQAVEVRVDAQGGGALAGKVRNVSGAPSRAGMFFGPAQGPVRMFDVIVDVEAADATLRPGVSAQVVIRGPEVSDALLVPRQAVFEKEGNFVLYVREAGAFVAREVEVKHRTASHAAVEGVREGDEVALVNPTAPTTQPGKAPAKPGPAIGGGR